MKLNYKLKSKDDTYDGGELFFVSLCYRLFEQDTAFTFDMNAMMSQSGEEQERYIHSIPTSSQICEVVRKFAME